MFAFGLNSAGFFNMLGKGEEPAGADPVWFGSVEGYHYLNAFTPPWVEKKAVHKNANGA